MSCFALLGHHMLDRRKEDMCGPKQGVGFYVNFRENSVKCNGMSLEYRYFETMTDNFFDSGCSPAAIWWTPPTSHAHRRTTYIPTGCGMAHWCLLVPHSFLLPRKKCRGSCSHFRILELKTIHQRFGALSSATAPFFVLKGKTVTVDSRLVDSSCADYRFG